jgi:iron complex outermembrane recepter protein
MVIFFFLHSFVLSNKTLLTAKKMKKIVFTLIASFALFFAQAQTGTIKGAVKTSDNQVAEPLNIGLKGFNKGVFANSNGEFEIKNVEAGTYILVVSFIGLETKEQHIEVIAGQTTTVPEIILKENSQQLKEVVITSFKSNNEKLVIIGKAPIKSMDLPQSVASIDKETLDQQQTARISDAVKNFNGIYIMGTSGGYQEELAGRGFAFNNSNTFKNGVRFNNTAMPEMSSLERVEAIKGSAAILFGNVSAGGVINLVTKKPLFEIGGEVSMRMGSYNFYKPSVDVYGSLNRSKTMAYRINTTYEKSQSFRDVVNAQRFYINPSLLFKLGKKTDILIEGDYLNDDRTADFGVGAINYTLIDIPRSRFIGVSWSYYKSEQKSSTAIITHRFNNKWEIRSATAYQNLNSDLFANQRPNGNTQFIKENGDWIRGLQRTTINEDYYITQLDLTGKFSTGFLKHILLVGADADKYLTNNTAYNAISKYDTVNVFDPDKYKQHHDIPDMTPRTLTTSPVKRAGIYVQDLMSITSKIKLLAGARLSYLETFGNVFTYSNSTAVKTRQFDNAFSPRIGIVYQPIKTMALFTSYANSFTPNSGVDVDGKALPPSLIDQYEAGIKNDLFHGLLSANVTVYQIKNSNLAQTSLANGNTNTNIKELVGEITSKGIELDITSKEWKGFSLIAGYSFNDTRYTKSNTYIEGSKLRYNPNHTANTSLYYNFNKINIKWLAGFNAGAGVLYIGERSAGRSTRVTVANDTYKLIPLSAYTNLEASIGYTKNNISLRIKMSNIMNELSYNVHDDNSVNPIAPRQVSATIGVKF